MLFKLDKKTALNAKAVTLADVGWKERDFEIYLAEHLYKIISEDLMVIFCERPRQEEPDIMCIDRNGDLHIFELKRWESQSENLLQVIRYGQLFGQCSYDDLNHYYSKWICQKNASYNTDLESAHCSYFGLDKNLDKNDFNKKIHLVTITNGLDQETISKASFWKKNGLQIETLTYFVYKLGESNYIEFQNYPYNAVPITSDYYCTVNTNKSNDPDCECEKDMLTGKKACAYNYPWMTSVEYIPKGAHVFLYKTGCGIIAHGIASGKTEHGSYHCEDDCMVSHYLDDFEILPKPISAWEINQKCRTGHRFRPTVYYLSESDGQNIIDLIKNKR